MDKSWDHPWTTEEMRKKRREWSLAGDAGLLKHLQQFSDVCINFILLLHNFFYSLKLYMKDLHLLMIFLECNIKSK